MSYGPKPWMQLHWDARAATNFILGGAGSGLAALAAVADAPAAVPVALALVALGLGAVWLEIGRKLRAAHVFFNPRTSWMTRESYAAVLLFGFGLFSIVTQDKSILPLAGLCALVFLWCQASILRASKGIPAWRAPQVMALILTTGLAEGAALLLFFRLTELAAALFGLAVAARAVAWSLYWSALKQPQSQRALEPAGRMLLQLGTVAPLLLLLAAVVVPQAALLAGLAALAAGWRLKFALVTRAAFNQGFALPHLPAR